MRTIAIVVILSLAMPVWAQEAVVEPPASDLPRDVKSAQPKEGGPDLGEGVWLSPGRNVWIGRQYRQCQDDKEQYKKALESKPITPEPTIGSNVKWALIGGGIGFVAGIVAAVITVVELKKR